MKSLGSCDGGISNEHLISESVIEILQDGGDFSISGLPWLAPGETKIIGPKALASKRLCAKHNSALHPLDDAAKVFFAALKNCLDREGGDRRYIVSGHDVERWLLKTAIAMAVSGNFGTGNVKHPGNFASDIDLIALLDDPMAWPETTGIYCAMVHGQVTQNHNRFQCRPLSNQHDEINGMIVDIMGVCFVLLLQPLDQLGIDLSHAIYRPSGIEITYENSVDIIAISWEDKKPPRKMFTMKFIEPSVGLTSGGSY